jgi:phage terminase large subunit
VAWSTAIPTVREDDAEIWVTWNPKRKKSATHKRFREKPPEGAKIVELNWRITRSSRKSSKRPGKTT